jgi:hypothetical protein
MKNVRHKLRLVSTRDNFSKAADHIHLLRINAFASEGINFTEKENAHFDVCHRCRLKVIKALRNLEPQNVRTIIIMPMAA